MTETDKDTATLPENRDDNRAFSPEFEAQKFKPGQSGNPGGRPKKKPITSALEAIFASESDVSDEEAMALARHMKNLAQGKVKFCEGGAAVQAAKFITDRIEGPIPTRIEGPGKDGAVKVELTRAEKIEKIRELLKRRDEREARHHEPVQTSPSKTLTESTPQAPESEPSDDGD